MCILKKVFYEQRVFLYIIVTYILLDSSMWNMAGYFYESRSIWTSLWNEFKMYNKEENFRIKYKVLENCVTKRRIQLYVFTRSQSYSHDIFYKLDDKCTDLFVGVKFINSLSCLFIGMFVYIFMLIFIDLFII